VRLAVLKPTALLELWGNSELEPLAQEAEDSLICIIDAVCRASDEPSAAAGAGSASHRRA
jgi:hypothetical protein